MAEQIKCRLKTSIYKQIQHLLLIYPKTEWSGVGFYNKLNEDKHGWATDWELVAFYPIDLGSTAATEFSGEDQIKLIQKAYKENPKLRECYKGLIHSHHTLGGGAFFSGTDRDHMEECANKVGYPSLVVACESTKSPFAFSFSWTDSFNKVHWTKEESGCVCIDYEECKPKGLFKKCLTSLEKQKKEEPKEIPTYYSRTGMRGQTALFNESFRMNQHTHGALTQNDVYEYYNPNIEDDKYQELLTKYNKAEKAWMDVPVGGPHWEQIQSQAIQAEKELDDYCIKNNLNDIGGSI